MALDHCPREDTALRRFQQPLLLMRLAVCGGPEDGLEIDRLRDPLAISEDASLKCHGKVQLGVSEAGL